MIERLDDNPYHVLAVSPDATTVEIERAGQKWLAMLGVGLEAAATYASPLGLRARDPDSVRSALARLRTPEDRWLWALFASMPTTDAPDEAEGGGWPEPLVALGVALPPGD